MRTISVKFFAFGQWFLELFKDIQSQMKRKHLCNFGRGEHFCEIILNSDQWFRRLRLKRFLIVSSGNSYA